MKRLATLLLCVVMGCGGDSTGPTEANYSGTYQGTSYIISTSTVPIQQRDSANGGPVTLTLAKTSGEQYSLSMSQASGGVAGGVTINSAGVVGFPNFSEANALSSLGSLLLGICNLNSASVSPSGVVSGRRLTITMITSGAVCDYSGNGSDIRATLIQVTLTGTN